MKPCDCLGMNDIPKLKDQGVTFNEWSLALWPSVVIISNNTTELRIPMNRFKAFAEWYLEDQHKKEKGE